MGWVSSCGVNPDVLNFSGAISLPSGRGGDFYVRAGCVTTAPGAECNQGGNHVTCQIWAGTPDTNGGACTPVGIGNGGVLMFDHQQPCPATEAADLPVPTAGLEDGRHELRVTATDAAGNSSTVLDETIATVNPSSRRDRRPAACTPGS